MKKIIVLYPGLAVSHFVPMMQLADILLEQGYAVKVALIDVTLEQNTALAASVSRVASSKPLVAFHTLPRIQNPPTFTLGVNLFLGYFELVRRYNEHFRDFLCSLPPRSVHAVILDVTMSGQALDLVKELRIPAYAFFPSNASFLAVYHQLSSFPSEDHTSFKELGDTPLEFLGVPPVPASHLTSELLEDPSSEIYKAMMNLHRKILESDGILMNTVESLEPRAVGALSGREFTMPPVYCVGPLVEGASGGGGGGGTGTSSKEKHECLRWLEKQPEGSVVFLCFGSIGANNHSKDQLREIAIGLEKSGHRFLWVVRAPPPDDPQEPFDPCGYPDLDVLPEGFLERTNARGLIVKLWAPQLDVLHHKATGAFVTHCGWNSVLEGIMVGVPMLCWPLYAEQKMNKVFMVEEYGVGVELAGWQHGLVKAEEVEAKVKMVMEFEEGKRVTEHREAAAIAWKHGGSSQVAFSRFLSDAGNHLSMGPARP